MRAFAAVALWVILAPGARAGEVRGTVRYRGAPPAAPTLAVTKDRAVCGPGAPDETLLVSEGGLANVVVRVAVPGAKAAPRTVALDQQRCRFVPHVLAAPVGSTLALLNGDPLLHGVHGYAGIATAFNVPMALQGQTKAQPLPRPGVIQVGCDIHGWMTAWIVVVDGPYHAVSDAAGRFVLRDVPAGSWPVLAWHERLGERAATLTVPASGDATLELSYP